MNKRYIFAPGPTPVPEEVSLEMAKPIIHHRTRDYELIFEEARENLRYLFKTKNEVLILASSGTGAMEAAVANTMRRGDKVLVVCGGKFGKRWEEICKSYGLLVRTIEVFWGDAVEPSLVKKALEDDPQIKGVFIQASETSTGVKHPIREIGEIVKEYENTILVVDAITGIGVFDIETDAWGLDVVVAGSQKALMLPPGLSFISLSEKAITFFEGSDLPKYYFDLKKELKSAKKNQNAYTPAVSLIVGLNKALKLIKEQGLENIFRRTKILAKATRSAALALGLELLAKDSPTEAVTAIKAPSGIDAQKIVKLLREKYGIIVAGGQEHLKGKIFRIAHMGWIGGLDIVGVISALEMVLSDLGYEVEFGKGVGAAISVMKKEGLYV